jgi:hypothetical protein
MKGGIPGGIPGMGGIPGGIPGIPCMGGIPGIIGGRIMGGMSIFEIIKMDVRGVMTLVRYNDLSEW